jgi:hypothetical protein
MQTRLAAIAGHRSYIMSLIETHPASDVRIQVSFFILLPPTLRNGLINSLFHYPQRIREAVPEAYAIMAASPQCGGTSEQLPGFLNALGLHGTSDDSSATASLFKSVWSGRHPGGRVAEEQRVPEPRSEVVGTGDAQDEVLVDKW